MGENIKTRRLNFYCTMCVKKMTAVEFREIQQRLGLSNYETALILGCSVNTVEAYRSASPNWSRRVPNAVAGLFRMVLRDDRYRNYHNEASKKHYRKHGFLASKKHYRKHGRGRPKRPLKNPKLTSEERKRRQTHYNRAYARYRRSGDKSHLEEFYEKFGRRRDP